MSSSARLQSTAALGARAITAPQPRFSARQTSRSTSGSSRLASAGLPARRAVDQPVGIVAAGMRDREQHRQVAARRMDDGGGEAASRGVRANPSFLCQIRTDVEVLQRMRAIFASGKTKSVRA